MIDSTKDSLSFIVVTERKYFRTEHDYGANSNALFVWNLVREQAGLPKLRVSDLTNASEYTDHTRDAVKERTYPLEPRE